MAYINGTQILFSGNTTIVESSAEVKQLRVDVDSNTRRLDALFKLNEGITYQFETDSDAAYSKSVLSGAKLASIKRIGGMSSAVGGELVHAKVTAVKSIGANLIPTNRLTTRQNIGVTFTVENGAIKASGKASGYYAATYDFPEFLLPAGTYTLSGGPRGSSGETYQFWCNVGDQYIYAIEDEGKTFTIEQTESVKLYFYCYEGVSVDGLVVYPMLNIGATALPYSPYTEFSLPIPEAVLALDGYGMGASETASNYVDFESKKFNRLCGVVDLETLYWGESAGGVWYTEGLVGVAMPNVGVCDNYTVIPTTAAEIADNKTLQIRDSVAYLKDLSITDASQIAGMLVYELATPQTEDISSILPDDNTITVEGGGSLTFMNEHEIAVPNAIEYAVKLSEV